MGSYTAIGGVLMIVGGAGFTAVELALVAKALATLETTVAMFTGTTDKSTGGHDGSPQNED